MFVVLHVESRLHVVDQLGLRNLKISTTKNSDISREHKTGKFYIFLGYIAGLNIIDLILGLKMEQAFLWYKER
jgi:hypothetical protein